MLKTIRTIILTAITCVLFITTASAECSKEKSLKDAEQTMLRLLFYPAYDAVETYYGEPRQYWNDKILCIKKVPNTPYYEVVMQVETFFGPHNPPYGIETMTFYISYGDVQLKNYKHEDEQE